MKKCKALLCRVYSCSLVDVETDGATAKVIRDIGEVLPYPSLWAALSVQRMIDLPVAHLPNGQEVLLLSSDDAEELDRFFS